MKGSKKSSELLPSIFLILLALALVLRAAADLVRGKVFYQNYYGGGVFVPFYLVLGIIALCAAILLPWWYRNRPGKNESRRGK